MSSKIPPKPDTGCWRDADGCWPNAERRLTCLMQMQSGLCPDLGRTLAEHGPNIQNIQSISLTRAWSNEIECIVKRTINDLSRITKNIIVFGLRTKWIKWHPLKMTPTHRWCSQILGILWTVSNRMWSKQERGGWGLQLVPISDCSDCLFDWHRNKLSQSCYDIRGWGKIDLCSVSHTYEDRSE